MSCSYRKNVFGITLAFVKIDELFQQNYLLTLKEEYVRKFMKFCLVSVAGILILSFLAQSVQALPTFARRFETSCSTCHVAAPKLTAFGESFRLNGYQIPEGDEKYLKEKDTSLGAPPWKEVWPNAIWPGAIPGSFPLSLWGMFDAKAPLEGENKELSFDFPHEVELFMAGSMGEDTPFFVEVEWEGGEVEAEAWLGFYNLFKSNRALNLRIGSFEINPLPMAFDHLRLGKEHYLYNNWRVPGSSNRFRLRGGQMGLELNGIVGSRFFYSAGMAAPDGGMDAFATMRLKLGGTPFDRSAPTEDDADKAISVLPTGFWVDNAFELAAFAYSGKKDVGSSSDSFNRLGAGVRWTYQNLDLSAIYLVGKNKDPWGDGSELDANGWHIEGSYYIFPWLIALGRYESLKLDNSATLVDQKQTIAGLIWMLRANIKLITEATLYNESSGKSDILQVRLLFGF
jgi:hypothetical protein